MNNRKTDCDFHNLEVKLQPQEGGAKFNLEDVTEKAVRHNLVEAIVPVFA
jgi:hypothetical protein